METFKTDPEAALLACLILHPETREGIDGLVRVTDFAAIRHRVIYQTLSAMTAASTPVDLVTLDAELERKGLSAQAGGPDYVSALTDSYFNPANAKTYAREVSAAALLRRKKSAAERMAKGLPGAEDELKEAMREPSEKAPDPDFAPKTMPELRELIEKIKNTPKIPTGIGELDDAVGGGYVAGKVVIIGAFVGNGKTTFLIHQALRHAFNGHPTLFVSAELSAPEIGLKVGNALSPMDNADVPNLEVIYADRPLPKVMEMADKWLDRHDASDKSPVVLVDFLQKVSNPTTQSRELQVSEIAWAFQNLSRKGPLVLLAAQLNRQSQGSGGEEGSAPKPMLHHLRESGNIEQVGDLAILLQKTGDDTLKFWVAKNRDGKATDVEVNADWSKCAFGTITESQKWSQLADKVVTYLTEEGSPQHVRDITRNIPRTHGTRPTAEDLRRCAFATQRFRVDDKGVWKL